MTKNEQALNVVFQSGDKSAMLKFFQGMEEADRASLRAKSRALLKTAPTAYVQTNGNESHFVIPPELPAGGLAVFSTGTLSDVSKLNWKSLPNDDEQFQVIADRQPDWTQRWVVKLLDDRTYWRNWKLVRRLIRARLCEKPDHPHYYLGMISGLDGGFRSESTVESKLLEDSDLLDDEIWKLFEYEGGGDNSLANVDRFSDTSWKAALMSLANRGRISRERLISCTFDALQRDFNHYRAKWFSSFHDELQLTQDERVQFAPRYLRLLACTTQPIVAWAFKHVQKIDKASPYAAADLIAALIPVLQSRQKGIVKNALKLVSSVITRNPEQTTAASLAAVEALAHEAADVQEAAWKWIETNVDEPQPELRTKVKEYVDLLASSVQPSVQQWLAGEEADHASTPLANPAAEESAPAVASIASVTGIREQYDPQWLRLYSIDSLIENIASGNPNVPATRFDGTEIARLRPEDQLEPVTDLDELIDLCSSVLEDRGQVDEAEMAIDGIARLCDQRPADFAQRVAPLAKRTVQLIKRDLLPFWGRGTVSDLAGCIYAWVEGQLLGPQGEYEIRDGQPYCRVVKVDGLQGAFRYCNRNKPLAVLSDRCQQIAMKVATGTASTPLSTPTHRGGWIDPMVLVDRVNACSDDSPDETDVVMAMLRLAPDRRAEALTQLKPNKQIWRQAIRYALGAQGVTIETNERLWVAAARARSPWKSDTAVAAAFPEQGPDAATAATYRWGHQSNEYRTWLSVASEPACPKSPSRSLSNLSEHPTVSFHLPHIIAWEVGHFAGNTTDSVRAAATLWPIARESFFARAAEAFAANLDWHEARWYNNYLLEPMLDPGTPLLEMATHCLTIALAAKEPGEQRLATDVATVAIEDGRLGTDNLGTAMRALLPGGMIKAARWAKSLAEVASVSDLHALVVQTALQTCLQGDPTNYPRDFAKLLALLRQLTLQLETSVGEAGCRSALSAISGTGQASKLAKQLLAIESGAASDKVVAAQHQAINCRGVTRPRR